MARPEGEAARSAGAARPQVARLYRLQWEAAQQAWVLLFPEGMIKLNGSAGEILRRCDGSRSTGEIIAELEAVFHATAVRPEVEAFLQLAAGKGWVEWREAQP
jgi:pyrroloquinoline quinone biosynthesis protein D